MFGSTSMMWFDGSSGRGLPEKIALAVAYYRQKYQLLPNLVSVNPQDNPGGITDLDGIRVVSERSTLKNHLIIGQSLKQEAL